MIAWTGWSPGRTSSSASRHGVARCLRCSRRLRTYRVARTRVLTAGWGSGDTRRWREVRRRRPTRFWRRSGGSSRRRRRGQIWPSQLGGLHGLRHPWHADHEAQVTRAGTTPEVSGTPEQLCHPRALAGRWRTEGIDHPGDALDLGREQLDLIVRVVRTQVVGQTSEVLEPTHLLPADDLGRPLVTVPPTLDAVRIALTQVPARSAESRLRNGVDVDPRRGHTALRAGPRVDERRAAGATGDRNRRSERRFSWRRTTQSLARKSQVFGHFRSPPRAASQSPL